MRVPLVFTAAVFTWMSAVLAKPAVFLNWPACKTTTEWVLLIPKAERMEGTIYYEHKTSRDTIKYYLCKPCTQCLSGILVLQPCSRRSDTQCSTECALSGCVMDELTGCRLPGDPNKFKSVSHMMDPCDPTKVTTAAETSTVVRTIPEIQFSTESDDKLSPVVVRPTNKEAEGNITSLAPVGAQTYVFAFLIGLLFIIMFVIICWMARQNHSKDGVRGQSSNDMIVMPNLPATNGHATSQV